jgi:phage-related protein
MAYNNPFLYNRDSSVKDSYNYINDLSIYKPIYGSSVSFVSRLNSLETVDNSLKILPSSENNISINFMLRFMLNDEDTGNLLKTIEIAGGYKQIKFTDPSNFYKNIIGIVENYSISKNSGGSNLNEVNISLFSYTKAPLFSWRTSSILEDITTESTTFSSSKSYKRHEFVYIDPSEEADAKNYTGNKIDNFWFAKNDISAGTSFSLNNWTKNFDHDYKLPFQLENNFDIYKADFKNSFIQTIKHKNNSNSLKKLPLKFDNIDDIECRSILFFLEKKCGYRRFIYDYPIFLKPNKVFICTQWTHVFKYKNCHSINLDLIEEPSPNIFIDSINGNDYYYII